LYAPPKKVIDLKSKSNQEVKRIFSRALAGNKNVENVLSPYWSTVGQAGRTSDKYNKLLSQAEEEYLRTEWVKADKASRGPMNVTSHLLDTNPRFKEVMTQHAKRNMSRGGSRKKRGSKRTVKRGSKRSKRTAKRHGRKH
jgi:hypothetical protein